MKANPTNQDLKVELERLQQRLRDRQDEVENLSNIIIQISMRKNQ